MFASTKIIAGGWPAFAEQTGVNKKEPVETFDWIASETDKFYYSDLCAALNTVEGSREWLKNYEFDEARDAYPFNSDIGRNLSAAMSKNHSGSSGYLTLTNYAMALRDWDSFVLRVKEFHGRMAFKDQQIPIDIVNSILESCNQWILHKDNSEKAKEIERCILLKCAIYGFTSTVPQIQKVLEQIKNDYDAVQAEDGRRYEEARHKMLIGSLDFLYKNPIRWFDTPSGCTLSPSHPRRISERAMAEMELKHPGYSKHIDNVLLAMGSDRKPEYINGAGGIFSSSGSQIWDRFLREEKVIV
jgi:hypothetical protein